MESPPQTYRLAQVLGTSAYVGRLCLDIYILTDANPIAVPQGLVFQAAEANSGRTVALKKSRVSQRESPTPSSCGIKAGCFDSSMDIRRHPCNIRVPHVEHLAMEPLGPSIKDCATGPVGVTTVVRVVLQLVRACCTQPSLHTPFT